MTKQESLLYAISVISTQPQTKTSSEAITILTEMAKSCKYIKWTKETVTEALDKWKVEHNRNPSVTDLFEPDMPKGETIKKLFDMAPSAFLNKYYPREHRKKAQTKYNLTTPNEYKEIFFEQYYKHKPTSSTEYETKRDIGTPSWTTIASHNGVNTWNNLLSLFELKKFPKKTATLNNRNFTITTHNQSYDELSSLLEERNETLKQIAELINKGKNKM